MNKLTALLLASCCLPCLTTAADASPARASETAAAAATPARPTISIGMKAEQVLELAGQPKRVRKLKQEGIAAEVWYYTFSKRVGVTQVASSLTYIPWVDPISGITKMMPEPVYTQQYNYMIETTELLMIDGALAQTKRYREFETKMD